MPPHFLKSNKHFLIELLIGFLLIPFIKGQSLKKFIKEMIKMYVTHKSDTLFGFALENLI
jgi:hypothetical protein